MAQYKTSIKTHKQSIKKALRNKVARSKMKTFIKKVEYCIKIKDLLSSILALNKAKSIIMQAVNKKVLKLNTASRKIRGLVRKIKFLAKP